jgi:hypothetical protein
VFAGNRASVDPNDLSGRLRVKEHLMKVQSAFISMAAGLAVSTAALAGPLTANHVAADATWVAHIDIEAFMASSLGQQPALREVMSELHSELNGAEVNLGLDPTRDIKNVTVSGKESDDDNALIVVSATSALDAPLARIGDLVQGYNAITEGDRTIHSWRMEDETVYAYVRPGTDPTERIVVFSGNLDQLRAGMLRVETGPAAALPEAIGGPGPSAGSFVYFRGADLGSALGEDAAAMLRSAQAVTFESGDTAGRFFARATLTTENADEATSIQQIAQGVYAMARLAVNSEPEAQPFIGLLNGFNATVSGATVTLSYEHDSAEIGRILGEQARNGGLEAHLEGLNHAGDHAEHHKTAKLKVGTPDAAEPQKPE